MTNEEFKKLSKEEQKNVPFKEMPKRNQVGCIVIPIIFFIGFLTYVDSCNRSYDYPSNEKAYEISHELVKDYLKAPASAIFPKDDYKVEIESDKKTYIIYSYVDSQNGFGALIRKKYFIKMMYVGSIPQEKKSWMTLDFQMLE
jgi:hypothetical protein